MPRFTDPDKALRAALIQRFGAVDVHRRLTRCARFHRKVVFETSVAAEGYIREAQDLKFPGQKPLYIYPCHDHFHITSMEQNAGGPGVDIDDQHPEPADPAVDPAVPGS